MKARTRRTIALVGSGLMMAGLAVGGASPASATADYDHGRDRDCDVDISQRGDELRVRIDAGRRDRVAFVRANFDDGRDDSDRVRLRNGNGRTEFDIPRRADFVRVTVRVDGDTCSDSLRLRDNDRDRDRDRGGRRW